LITGTIAAIAAGVPFPLLGIIFGQLVDSLNDATCSASSGISDRDAYQAAVNSEVLKVVYITVASFVSIYIYVVSWRLLGERLVQRLRDQYFRSLLCQEASFFDKLRGGEVSSRLNGDIEIILSGTTEKVGIVIASSSFFITAYIVAFLKDAKLAGMLVSLVPAFLIMSLVGSKYINKYASLTSEFTASASSVASEGLSSLQVVQAYGANVRLEKKFADDLRKAMKAGVRKVVTTAIQTGLLYFIAYAGNALAFWQGSRTIAASVGRDGEQASVGVIYTVIFILVDGKLRSSMGKVVS
jgi:ATP-binding cassette subfamily B (MDR/TAP) protein 1